MNKLTIIGNLTRDPESRTTPNGNNVCTFTVAVNRRRSQNSNQPEADFFRVSVFGVVGENCQRYLAKGRKADFDFYNTVERLAPQVIAEKRHIYKGVSTNVDFYSGFVYNMLGIPVELYTPMFAVARVGGWSAHRMEELVNVDKIIRPAYKSVMATRDYLPMENRG